MTLSAHDESDRVASFLTAAKDRDSLQAERADDGRVAKKRQFLHDELFPVQGSSTSRPRVQVLD